MAQLMPLPPTVSCFSKVQIDCIFLVPAHPGSPGQRAVKRVCVYVTIFLANLCIIIFIIILSDFHVFASEAGETKIGDGFTRYAKLVSVS